MTQMPVHPISLSPLADTAFSGEALIAFGAGGERTGRDFSRDVSELAARVAAVRCGRWLVDTVDRYSAAVCLFAVARCGGLAVLPPSRQPEMLEQLAEGAVGILADAGDPGALPEPTVRVGSQTPLGRTGRQALPSGGSTKIDREVGWIEFRTSGTSGDGQPVVKAMRHLEDEVRVLEARLGHDLPGDARFFATASHRHIYGLLFGVLWPLAAGRPFQRELLLHAQELLPRMGECGASALVTTPVHLKRMAEAANLEALRGSCRRVFSSGGPLDSEAAAAVAHQLGSAPYEIFGSTETGGVAFRCRDEHAEDWEPLPGVEIRRRRDDGQAEVTSPFVSVGERCLDGRTRTVMGDRIALRQDGRFRVLGRADRVVKIAEKRLSLPELECGLAEHPFVEEAALLVRDAGRESRVHAVVAPSAIGREAFIRDGVRTYRAVLLDHLAKRFDRVFLPRGWRFVAALPRDGQDKVPLAALQALFETPRHRGEADRPTMPRVLAESKSVGSLERRFEVPSNLTQLDGHFDSRPVVAGVVQLDWALRAAADWLGVPPALVGLEALKFPQPLLPGGLVTLRLERTAGAAGFRFRIFEGECIFATGRAVLAADRTVRGSE